MNDLASDHERATDDIKENARFLIRGAGSAN